MSSYFFVVGCPRSGTTLLSVLLDRHSRLAVPPETGFFDEVAPKLKRFDGERLRKVLRGWRRLPELGLEPEQVVERRPSSPAEVLGVILDLYAAANGKARCGEKTPQHLRYVPFILQQFAGAKIICLLRDGRDVVLSLRAMPWWRGSLSAAAKLWTGSAALAEKLAALHPAHFLLLRYEELVSRPAEVVPRVMDHLGESFEPSQLDPGVASRSILPRSMEWKGQALGPIAPNRIGHRRTASPRDLSRVENLLAKDLHRYGY